MTDHANELRRLAQAATPGPWMLRTAPTSAGLCHIISAADWRGAFIYGDGLRIGVDDSLPKAQELAANARLTAAANPAAISELLDRIEAAEKDIVLKERVIDALGSELNAVANERDALRAKVDAMERQAPVATVIKEGDSRYWMSERLWTFPDGKYPLYALPGAKGEVK